MESSLLHQNNTSVDDSTLSTGFKCVDELRKYEAIHSGLYLDNQLKLDGTTDPPSLRIAQAIYADSLSLAGKPSDDIAKALTVFSKVSIQAKKDFNQVSDDLIHSLASKQPDLSTKAQAFGVLDNPIQALDILDDVYQNLSSEDKPNYNLHASADMIDSLSKHIPTNPELKEWKKTFEEILITDSFATKNPYYLTKLALQTDPAYINLATVLVTAVSDSKQAVQLLTDKHGWLAIDNDKQNDALDALTGVVVQNGTDSDLIVIAQNVDDKTVHESMIGKLSAQAFKSGYDGRLATYLSSTEVNIGHDEIRRLHIELIQNFNSTDTLASQKALKKLVEKHNANNEVYQIAKLDRTIQDGENYLNSIKNNNADKTLVEITNARLVFESNKEWLDTKIIDLPSLSNEQTLRNAIVYSLLGADDPDNDYDFSMVFKDGTSDLLKDLITKQVVDSINLKPNDLDRILNQPVPVVVERLDSRSEVQDKLQFDAGMLNADNSAEKSKPFQFESKKDGTLLNVNALSKPVIIINDDSIYSYRFEDYASFDDLANELYANHPDIAKKPINYKLDKIDSNNYIDDNLTNDVDSFINLPSYESLNRLNQYFTHSVQEFIESREKDPTVVLDIEDSIKKGVDYNATSSATINARKNKVSP